MNGLFYRRHLLQTLLWYTLGIAVILLLLGFGLRFRGYLSDAIQGSLQASYIGRILLLRLPEFALLILPLSLCCAVALKLVQMHSSGEHRALRSLGAGDYTLVGWCLYLAVPVFALMLFLSLHLAPSSIRQSEELIAEARYQSSLFAPKPSHFAPLPGGAGTVYIHEKLGEDSWQEIFVSRGSSGDFSVIRAQRLQRNGFDFVMQDGTHHRFAEGRLQSGASYQEYGFYSASAQRRPVRDSHESRPLGRLLQERSAVATAELQWRLAAPFMTVLPLLMAVPMARTRSRKNVSWRVGLCFIVFILYFAILLGLRSAVEHGLLPTWPGVWLGHMVAVLVLGVLWRSQRGWWLWMFTLLALLAGIAVLPL